MSETDEAPLVATALEARLADVGAAAAALVHAGRDRGAGLPRVPSGRGGGRGGAVRPPTAATLGRLLLQRERPVRGQQPRRRDRGGAVAAPAGRRRSRSRRRARQWRP